MFICIKYLCIITFKAFIYALSKGYETYTEQQYKHVI